MNQLIKRRAILIGGISAGLLALSVVLLWKAWMERMEIHAIRLGPTPTLDHIAPHERLLHLCFMGWAASAGLGALSLGGLLLLCFRGTPGHRSWQLTLIFGMLSFLAWAFLVVSICKDGIQAQQQYAIPIGLASTLSSGLVFSAGVQAGAKGRIWSVILGSLLVVIATGGFFVMALLTFP